MARRRRRYGSVSRRRRKAGPLVLGGVVIIGGAVAYSLFSSKKKREEATLRRLVETVTQRSGAAAGTPAFNEEMAALLGRAENRAVAGYVAKKKVDDPQWYANLISDPKQMQATWDTAKNIIGDIFGGVSSLTKKRAAPMPTSPGIIIATPSVVKS